MSVIKADRTKLTIIFKNSIFSCAEDCSSDTNKGRTLCNSQGIIINRGNYPGWNAICPVTGSVWNC